MYPVVIPPLSEFHHCIPMQLRFNDIDILGHLNNTVYFSLYDTGKAAYFNSVRDGKMNFRKVETVIGNVDCAFLQPIHYGDDVVCYNRCIEIRDKSFVVEQMLVDGASGKVFSICHTVMVCFDPATGKTREISPELAESFCKYEGRDLRKK